VKTERRGKFKNKIVKFSSQSIVEWPKAKRTHITKQSTPCTPNLSTSLFLKSYRHKLLNHQIRAEVRLAVEEEQGSHPS